MAHEMNDAAIHHSTTPNGTEFAICQDLTVNPAPTLLLFALSDYNTLATSPYKCVGENLALHGWNIVSIDLPCHGKDRRINEPEELAGWAQRIENGENIMLDFCRRVNDVINFLVETRIASPKHIAAAGTSRGGFAAFHAAAANPLIRAVAAFSPVTHLLALTEFNHLHKNLLAEQLSLTNLSKTIADRAIWIIIGNKDQRVSTQHALAFVQGLTQHAETQNQPCRVSMTLQPTIGHNTFPVWHKHAAQWLREQF